MNPKELLLRTARGPAPHPLELYVRLKGESELHLHAQGITVADFGDLFANEIRGLDVLIYRMPPDLLNPNYWEPHTREAEQVVREKLSGVVTRAEGDKILLWRADRVARGRLLRDDLDAPVELLNGYIFRTTGEGLLKLGKAWNGRDRFDWAGLAGLPPGEIASKTLSSLHHDLSQSRLRAAGAVFLFASTDEGLTRVLFSRRAHFDRALEAVMRGFVHSAKNVHVGRISRATLDQLARIADGIGLSADPERDVEDKDRTVEVHAWVGRTPWGVSKAVPHQALLAEGRILIYYDRQAGLWAVAG